MIGEQPEHLVREQRLVVMVSGNGSNLQALFDACADGTINGRVVAVVSNKAEVFALQRADAAGVPAVHIGLRLGEDRQDYDARLTDLVA
ncbi:MAG: formyltransferase family protein, partial [Ilumatobacter sp.]|nr:formyltransferase family protein [Ilumatobacter sp.]